MRRAVTKVIGVLLVCALLPACTRPGQADDRPGKSCLEQPEVNCQAADLSGMDLSGRDLSEARLVNAVLDGADLSSADLSAADLTGASLRGAVLANANLTDARLVAADLRLSDLSSSRLVGATLHEANLTGADLSAADASGTLLTGTSFREADLSGAKFDNAVVLRSDFRSASLTGSNWQGAVVRAEDSSLPAVVRNSAVSCGFRECTNTDRLVGNAVGAVAVPAEALDVSLNALTRFAMAYAESPNLISRALALSMLSAAAVYGPENQPQVNEFAFPDQAAPAGIGDAAAVYALLNTAVALRFNADHPERNARLHVAENTAAGTLWELTRATPELRAAVVFHATRGTAAALVRADSDGFANRVSSYAGAAEWVPTPPGYAPPLEPGWGQLLNYVPGAQECRAGSPSEDGREQALDVLEIAAQLTDDQRAAARFWDDERIRTTTPVGHWHNIAVSVMGDERSARPYSVREKLDILLRLHLALADTVINVWKDKFEYGTARPITLVADEHPGWNSYLGNPPFPAYPSGHAAVSKAAADVLTRFVGDVSYTDNGGTENPAGLRILNVAPRTFPDFQSAADEAGMSRIWGGIHVVDDFEGGQRIGKCVADLWAGR